MTGTSKRWIKVKNGAHPAIQRAKEAFDRGREKAAQRVTAPPGARYCGFGLPVAVIGDPSGMAKNSIKKNILDAEVGRSRKLGR